MRRVIVSAVVCALVSGTVAGMHGATIADAVDVLPFSCSYGAGIVGDGSSFQDVGVQAAITAYSSMCGNSVTYTATGSGMGIADFTARAVQFAGTTIPYSHAQWATMQAGSDTNASHVETIPIALGPVVIAVNEPCAAGADISGALLGEIYAQRVVSWSQVVPSCPADPIVAFHRSGYSGDTAVLKSYLTKKDPVDFAAGCPMIAMTPPRVTCYQDPSPRWPAPGIACAGPNTDAFMATCVYATAHSIGYVAALSAAQLGLTTVAVDNANGTVVDSLDLLGLGSVSQTLIGVFGPATFGFETWSPGQCLGPVGSNATPVSPGADWSQVDITDRPNGYGICTFTYQLAFDTPVLAGAANLPQAITISNFIAFEVSSAGQAIFAANDYDVLPLEVQTAAEVATQALTDN